jgi:ABC-type Fe3+ transport system permease subunit
VDAWRIQEIYYRAKNIVYAEDNYFHELQELYARLGFVRSMLFVAIAASLAVFVASVVRLYRLWKRHVLSDGNEDTLRRAITGILAALLTACLAILLAKSAYLSEEQNYNNRVYGYFDTVVFKERNAE